MNVAAPDRDERLSTGIDGLDSILNGGFPARRSILIEGAPGTGKTTLALQFMAAAAARGEKAVFCSVAQSQDELNLIARSHDIGLDAIDVVTPALTEEDEPVSVATEATALQSLLEEVKNTIEAVKPDVLVFDSLLEMRLLSPDAYQFRRNLLILRRALREAGVTALLLDHVESTHESYQQGVVHGVIQLRAAEPTIGRTHRAMTVIKMRGATFREGLHDFRIETGGLEVFPRVIPSERGEAELPDDRLELSEETLNRMLGGGMEFGTSLLIAGQAGSGKSTLGTLIATSAAREGRKAALFLFEERPKVFRERSDSLNLDLTPFEKQGQIVLEHFEPAEISPGEFSRQVIGRVEEGFDLVVIDSLSGYLNALPDRQNVETHLQTLIQYLTRQGCLVVVTMAQKGLLGEPPVSEFETSYLADAVIILRQYARGSQIRRSIAVLKKRHSHHERGIQELTISPGRVSVTDLSDDIGIRQQDAKQMTSD